MKSDSGSVHSVSQIFDSDSGSGRKTQNPAESTPELRIHDHLYRAPNDCGEAESPNNITSTFFNTVHLLQKISGSTMVAPNLLLAPGTI